MWYKVRVQLNSFQKLINLYIYFWLRWVFVAACRLSLVAVSRGYYSLLCCASFSLRWLLCCGARALGHRLSSCGS